MHARTRNNRNLDKNQEVLEDIEDVDEYSENEPVTKKGNEETSNVKTTYGLGVARGSRSRDKETINVTNKKNKTDVNVDSEVKIPIFWRQSVIRATSTRF